MHLKLLFMLISGTTFFLSTALFLYVRIALKPKHDDDWEQVHWEFEDQNPALKRYNLWHRIAFSAVVISMLALFLTSVL